MIMAQGVKEEIANELCYGDVSKALPQAAYKTLITAEKSGKYHKQK